MDAVTRIAAIDPGYARGKGNAVAGFVDGRLVQVAAVPYGHGAATVAPVNAVVIERPQQDARSRTVPPATLIKLAWSGALLAGYFAGRDGARIVEYTPTEWKGSEAKPVMHARLWSVLDANERAVLGGDATWRVIEATRMKGATSRWRPGSYDYPAKWTTADALDACAIGCFYLGRLPRVGP